MAQPSTIFKANIQISDMDRHYYGDHQLTLARHPSETNLRMMVRLLAFALHAGEQLNFTRGLCADDEPEIWQKSLTDVIELWIDVGLPDEKRVRKACGRSDQVYLYLYGSRSVEPWWQKNMDKLQRFDNLSIIEIPDPEQMTNFVQRNMELQYTIQDGEIWLSGGELTCTISPIVRK